MTAQWEDGELTPPDQPRPVVRLSNNYGPAPYYKQLKEPPLLFEPLKGYRHWLLRGGHLQSPMNNQARVEWKPGEMVAWCKNSNKWATECLRVSCGCGFYSVWSANHDYARPTQSISIGGVIEIYGKVVVGEYGARASKCRVVALHLPDDARWSPFKHIHTLRSQFPEARFYRNWNNLIRNEKVNRPDHLVHPEGGYG